MLLAPTVRAESRAVEPIIPLTIFRSRTVSPTTIAGVLVGVALFGGTVFPSQYFQVALGKSPTVAGLTSLPMIFGLLPSSTVAGQLITKFGRWKAYLVAGASVMAVGMQAAQHHQGEAAVRPDRRGARGTQGGRPALRCTGRRFLVHLLPYQYEMSTPRDKSGGPARGDRAAHRARRRVRHRARQRSDRRARQRVRRRGGRT